MIGKSGNTGEKCGLVNIGAEIQKNEIAIEIEADAIVLLFPAYAYGAPIAVRNFVKRAVFKTGYIASFVTFGTSPGGALAEVCRILRRRKIKSVFSGRIPAVENYIAIFGPQSEKTIEKRVQMQRTATDEAVRIITGRKTNRISTFRPFSGFVSALFSLGIKLFYKWYRVNADCNGCEMCAKICPVSAIAMSSGKPVFSKKCEHCQGCINWCPKQAIEFARVKSGTQHYHHPEVNINDMSS